jgi:hypothetical protein
MAGSSTLLWEWALYCVALPSSAVLQLNPLMAVAFALYPTYIHRTLFIYFHFFSLTKDLQLL